MIELLVTMGLTSLLLMMGVLAARQFWFQRSLVGGQDQVATQLRALQQRVVADGVSSRYYGAWFAEGTDNWGTVRYDSNPTPPPASTCTRTAGLRLDAEVRITTVEAATSVSEVDLSAAIAACRGLASIPNNADFVWFLSRGMATETIGQHIVLTQPRLDNRSEEIRVFGLTGRVEKV